MTQADLILTNAAERHEARVIEFGSVCSGIEASSVAFEPLGWGAAWFAEIEAFPSAVLAHRFPHVRNLGDMTLIAREVLEGAAPAPDVLCGGTPCQAFSVAGLRESLSDARGGLTLKFVELANAIDHVRTRRGEGECVVLWENVPGVLSTKDNAFGCFLGALVGESEPIKPAGGKWTDAGCVYGPQRTAAWRVLDAQYFGLAQRRRRVFVVASAREGFDPGAVLFEFDGVRRDTAPSREAWQGTANSAEAGVGGSRHNSHWNGGVHPPLSQASQTRAGGIGGSNQEIFEQGGAGLVPAVAATLTASFGRLLGQSGQDADNGHSHLVPYTAHTLRGEGFDASEDGTGRGTPLVPVACLPFDTTQVTSATNRCNPQPGDTCHPLAAGAHAPAIAFNARQDPDSWVERTGLLDTDGSTQAIAFSSKDYSADATGELAPTLRAMNHAESHANGGGQMAVAYTTKLHNTASNNAGKIFEERTTALDACSPPPALLTAMQVRRLTPRECERLQDFPDDWTLIPWRGKPEAECPDGPRYKALGNSWAVPVVRWIGRRIDAQLRRST